MHINKHLLLEISGIKGNCSCNIHFSIYLNDLPTAPTFCNLESYVDDSKLFMSFPLVELDTAIEKLEQDLHSVAQCAVRTIYLSIPIKLNSFSSVPDRC